MNRVNPLCAIPAAFVAHDTLSVGRVSQMSGLRGQTLHDAAQWLHVHL
jgi:hypothetical protein